MVNIGDLKEDTTPPSKHKIYSPAFFGGRFVEKDGGLRTHKPYAEEVRGLQVFLF
jgi:hypothetical protein